MLKLIHASKIYAKNGICALNAVDLTVQDGDYISVTGASGSGKSTLMHILGLLDSLTDGEYLLDGAAVAHLPAKQRARLRSEKIGFVFQQFRLLTGMTALENVADVYKRQVWQGTRSLWLHTKATRKSFGMP